MRKKFFIKLGILGLAAIFLLSTSSYAPPKKGGKPPELYKVTISINEGGPGIDTGFCGSLGYFYAERLKGNFLLGIRSEGRNTPGPDDEVAPLNMWVNTGVGDIDHLENCFFEDEACYEETDRSPGWFGITILKSYDGEDPNEDISMRWVFDFTKVESGKKKERGREWHLYSLPYAELPHVYCTTSAPPEGLTVNGDPWETDVIGPFVLHHSGEACSGGEDMYNRQVLGIFNIHLTIERVR